MKSSVQGTAGNNGVMHAKLYLCKPQGSVFGFGAYYATNRCISRAMTSLCGMYVHCVYGSSQGQNTAISYAKPLFDRDEPNALVTTFPFFWQTSLQISEDYYHHFCIQSST